MLTYDSALAAQVAAAPNKLAECNAIIAALGPTRTLRIFRDNASGAANPFLTGVEVQNVAMTGTMSSSGGAINNFGVAGAHVIRLAADISTGTCCLRLEGNGHFVQGSLSLAPVDGSAINTDWALTANPTASSGIGFNKTASLGAYGFLPSGTGPAAPGEDPDRPAAFTITTYPNPADMVNGVTTPPCYINVRDRDLVPDHPYLAGDMGDIKMYRVADGGGIVIGAGGDCFRFAVTVMGVNGAINEDVPGKTVWEARANAVPHGRWANYPYKANFNIATDTLSPQPFKLNLLRADLTVLEVFEMFSTRDVNETKGSGKPINFTGQLAGGRSETQPTQPWWTCQMSLIYRSARTKLNSKALHMCPGVFPDAVGGTNVMAFDAQLDQWPIVTGGYSLNGLLTWNVAPRWPSKQMYAYGPNGFDTDIFNPAQNMQQMRRENYLTQVAGWDYEPGANGTATWYMSPGGSRHDRGPYSTELISGISQPTGLRPHGNIPYRTLMEGRWKNYGNEGMHYHTNLERGITIAKKNVLGIEPVCYNDCYYSGGNEDYVPDNNNHAIRLLTTPRSSGPVYADKNGRNFTNDYQRDTQHANSNAACMAFLGNSALGFLEGKSSFDSIVLCDFDFSQNHSGALDFLTRQHAWYNWGFANMWMITSNDPRSISREELEHMWQAHLEHYYDLIYPVATGTTVSSVFLRNLGMMPGSFDQAQSDAPGTRSVNAHSDAKTFYMGQVLMTMKQSGSWAAMRARSTKCAWILDFMITCLAKFSVDFFMDGRGRGEGLHDYTYTPGAASGNTALPATWAEMTPDNYPYDVGAGPGFLHDWIHKMDGTLTGSNGYFELNNTQHYRAQFVWILRDFFPERNFPRVNECCALLDGWYAEVAASGNQWHYRFAMMGKFKAPDVVGPV